MAWVGLIERLSGCEIAGIIHIGNAMYAIGLLF